MDVSIIRIMCLSWFTVNIKVKQKKGDQYNAWKTPCLYFDRKHVDNNHGIYWTTMKIVQSMSLHMELIDENRKNKFISMQIIHQYRCFKS